MIQLLLPNLLRCGECLKPISDDEYAVNWGSCNNCYDEHLELYFETHPEQMELFECENLSKDSLVF